jgi:hypothetical protein
MAPGSPNTPPTRRQAHPPQRLHSLDLIRDASLRPRDVRRLRGQPLMMASVTSPASRPQQRCPRPSFEGDTLGTVPQAWEGKSTDARESAARTNHMPPWDRHGFSGVQLRLAPV